ncbi:DUF2017 family protein [uncultured Amnibacterium sp.]|uniref:DUF2017 family protein n=1 Tax=uncultured Amnibacterium sp. TaxID=1631851 RepID=UPI0035CC103E
MRILGEFRIEDGAFVRRFTGAERKMIGNLATGLADTMAAVDDPAGFDDPVLRRLLPEAAPGDLDASAEFAAATRERLAAGKSAGARRLVADLEAAPNGVVRLDEDAAVVWLKALGDLRIALAERVGIVHVQKASTPQGLVYAWLTWLQGSLVEALDAS